MAVVVSVPIWGRSVFVSDGTADQWAQLVLIDEVSERMRTRKNYIGYGSDCVSHHNSRRGRADCCRVVEGIVKESVWQH